ncbi:hypothetical protein HW130_17675 [Streptomyces sp. PKU-EA00015]|uniref:hypothetical protein n=1 Tax=Streptomyces sp. PKU-EA00015 TaxID=2748326 RepID=UPI0015A4BE8D|nr:hypothetical protein [Streptomyces sp. PKU-EA00015]NWF28073.1 hypothetical protein [Streptomyces sp. PKU-EA00015]
MSETTGTGTAAGHEDYSFACMYCGHGWEQSYDIEHHTDGAGRAFVVYKTGGVRVPSPLKAPTCVNCGRHRVRIMRAGQVSSVRDMMAEMYGQPRAHPVPTASPAEAQGAATEAAEPPAGGAPVKGEPPGPVRAHHWHLSDLLHPFHHRK